MYHLYQLISTCKLHWKLQSFCNLSGGLIWGGWGVPTYDQFVQTFVDFHSLETFKKSLKKKHVRVVVNCSKFDRIVIKQRGCSLQHIGIRRFFLIAYHPPTHPPPPTHTFLTKITLILTFFTFWLKTAKNGKGVLRNY